VTENVIEMARQLEVVEVEVQRQDVAECMGSHSQPLSNEDLLTLEELRQEDVPEEYPSLSLKAYLPEFSLKSSIISKLAWLFWKTMI
jgi:hypothetical protein